MKVEQPQGERAEHKQREFNSHHLGPKANINVHRNIHHAVHHATNVNTVHHDNFGTI